MEKRLKRFICLFVTSVMLSSVFTGCSISNGSGSAGGTTGSTSQSEKAVSGIESTPKYEKLKVGVLVGSSAMPVLYAEEQGWFKDAGLNVDVVVFPAGAPINEAFGADQLDVASLGMAGIFGLAVDQCVLLAEYNTAGGIGMFVRNDNPLLTVRGQNTTYADAYGSAELAKGLEVLLPLGSASQYVLLEWAFGFGLTEADLRQVHMEYPAGYQAFSAGEGDAFVVSPPYYFDCLNDGYREISGFDQEFLRDIVMARKSIVESRRDEIVIFLRECFRACDALSDDKVRFDFCMKTYAELGAVYTEETMNQEIEVRKFITKETMSQPGYVFCEWLLPIADFYVSTEKITQDQIPVIETSVDTSLMEEALNFKLLQ